VDKTLTARAVNTLDGARFRTKHDQRLRTLTVGPHSGNWGFEVDVPAGTVVVVRRPVEGATAFGCTPEDERVGRALVPREVWAENPGWSGFYDLIVSYGDMSDLLEPVPEPAPD
jgi:hypothetical protein